MIKPTVCASQLLACLIVIAGCGESSSSGRSDAGAKGKPGNEENSRTPIGTALSGALEWHALDQAPFIDLDSKNKKQALIGVLAQSFLSRETDGAVSDAGSTAFAVWAGSAGVVSEVESGCRPAEAFSEPMSPSVEPVFATPSPGKFSTRNNYRYYLDEKGQLEESDALEAKIELEHLGKPTTIGGWTLPGSMIMEFSGALLGKFGTYLSISNINSTLQSAKKPLAITETRQSEEVSFIAMTFVGQQSVSCFLQPGGSVTLESAELSKILPLSGIIATAYRVLPEESGVFRVTVKAVGVGVGE
jgi:hypothetical protein